MKCKVCGNDEFIGHQVSRADIKVDENGEFLENLEGGLSFHVYDCGDPYGPFTCTRCGAEYDELKDGALMTGEPDPDWQQKASDHKKTAVTLTTATIFRWLADHDNTDEMFQIFGKMDLDGVMQSYRMPEIIRRVSDRMIADRIEIAGEKSDRPSICLTDLLTGILKEDYDLEAAKSSIADKYGTECYIQNVLAISRDGSDVYTLVISFETPSKDFNIEEAVRAAATDFCKTPDGRKVYDYNCESFNWSDFDMQVPNEICVKYGFRKIDSRIGTIEVNWDEHLVNDYELGTKEDNTDD